MGEIWRLDTARGRWAVKWQFPWAATEARPADLRVQALAAEAGIRLPRPVTTAAGDAVVAIGDRHVRVYQWVDLLAGYAEGAGGLPPLRHGLFSTTIAVHLNFLHAMAGQALDDPAHRGYAEERIASLLDHDLDDLRGTIGLASAALKLAR
jgi:hypothetical protein